MSKKSITWFSTLLSTLLLSLVLCSGCKSRPTEIPVTTSPLTSPLAASPIATPQATTMALTAFRLDEPLLEGATRVTGGGPAGVPIIIEDVSYMKAIGSGRIDQDGQFSIEVDPPLVAYSLIGIMLDESQGSPYSKEELPCGERCRDQPMVGALFYYAPVTRP
jgi:hypothetical protein